MVLYAPSVRIWATPEGAQSHFAVIFAIFFQTISIFRLTFAILYSRYSMLKSFDCEWLFPPLRPDGRPLTLDEIWKSVHACYQARLLEGPWDTITQQVRNHWSFTKLMNAIYAWILNGLIPLLDTCKIYKSLTEVVLSQLPTIVSVLDFEGYRGVHHVRLNVTVSLI